MLVGRPVGHRREGESTTPHFQVHLDGAGTRYRVAVNVRSKEPPSELLYLLPGARIYAFGQRWGPEPATRDKVFGFLPGSGVHDVHEPG